MFLCKFTLPYKYNNNKNNKSIFIFLQPTFHIFLNAYKHIHHRSFLFNFVSKTIKLIFFLDLFFKLIILIQSTYICVCLTGPYYYFFMMIKKIFFLILICHVNSRYIHIWLNLRLFSKFLSLDQITQKIHFEIYEYDFLFTI